MYLKNVCRKLNPIHTLILLAIVVLSCPAFSQVAIGLDFTSVQENRSSTQTHSVGRTVLDGHLNLSLNKESLLYTTVGYLSINSIESYADDTSSKIDTKAPYAGLGLHFWKRRSASLMIGGFYSPLATLSISESVGNESWEGSAAIGKVSGCFELSQKIKLNAGIYYISESFTSRTSGNVTSKSSLSQSYFAPSLGIAVAF